MTNRIKREIKNVQDSLKKIEKFMKKAPEGCLKWQKRGGKTYYYHQFLKGLENDKSWGRAYIKKEELELAKKLAQKQYYQALKPKLEKRLKELNQVLSVLQNHEIGDVYDSMREERRILIEPVEIGVQERLRRWREEQDEKEKIYPENLRYKTEQGEYVRSKSEVIIANMLYQHRKQLVYKYERPLQLLANSHIITIHPDFTILDLRTGRTIYWEHAGKMDDPAYGNNFVHKMNTYIENDLLPGREVLITYETIETPLNTAVVRKMIDEILIE